MTVIQQLRQLRINQGVTQEQLAAKAGYYRSTVERWENGKHSPSDRALTDLAQALGYDLVLRPRQ